MSTVAQTVIAGVLVFVAGQLFLKLVIDPIHQQFDSSNRPVHVVWGIPKGFTSPAILVTAYRPDSARWNSDFTERRK